MRFWSAWHEEERAPREVGSGKTLISKPIGWRGAGNPMGWSAIGLLVTPLDFHWGPCGMDDDVDACACAATLSETASPSLASTGMPHAMRFRMHGTG